MVDEEELFGLIGDAMVTFLQHRLARRAFPNAHLSQRDMRVREDAWKRGLVFTFMARSVYGKGSGMLNYIILMIILMNC
jgi:hypothetical protein